MTLHLPVRLRLLGAPSLQVGRKVVAVGSNKAMALLCYLAWRRGETLRSELDALLWPESERITARRSLRGELLRLNKLLPQGSIITMNQYLKLSSLCEVDLWQFEEAIHTKRWESAVTLYQGGLLEGFSVRKSESFESWHGAEQERLQAYYLEALTGLSERAAKAGEIGAALAYTQQIIRTNPLSEGAYIRGMRWAQQLRETAIALDIYHGLQDVLKREFGIMPSREATNLAREVASSS